MDMIQEMKEMLGRQRDAEVRQLKDQRRRLNERLVKAKGFVGTEQPAFLESRIREVTMQIEALNSK